MISIINFVYSIKGNVLFKSEIFAKTVNELELIIFNKKKLLAQVEEDQIEFFYIIVDFVQVLYNLNYLNNKTVYTILLQ